MEAFPLPSLPYTAWLYNHSAKPFLMCSIVGSLIFFIIPNSSSKPHNLLLCVYFLIMYFFHGLYLHQSNDHFSHTYNTYSLPSSRSLEAW